MKKVNFFNLAVIVAGSFFGAGFLSGNELIQFFGRYGNQGIISAVLVVLLCCVFFVILMKTAVLRNEVRLENVILDSKRRFLKGFVSFLLGSSQFMTVVIMASGVGALLSQIFDLNFYFSVALFCILLCFLSFGGISKVSTLFSITMPVIFVLSLVISIVAILREGWQINQMVLPSDNSLSDNLAVSALSYMSYSFFSASGGFCTLSPVMKSKTDTVLGCALGSVVVSISAVAIIAAVNSFPDSCYTQLPMLTVAFNISGLVGYIYAIMLMFGMFGAALVRMSAITDYMRSKFVLSDPYLKISVIIMSGVIFIISGTGFSNLIGGVYPIYGYLGIIAPVLLVQKFLQCKKMKTFI